MSATDSPRPVVSLVFPAYNEVENAEAMLAFFAEVIENHPTYRFDMLVVDDGSSDGTAARLLELAGPADRITVVSLSRRFGSHAALSAGLAHAVGDAAITLSADRQEPLEAIGLFLTEWEAGADLVWGLRSVRVQQQRVQGGLAQSFSRVFQRNSDVPTYPADGPSQVLLSRAVIDTLTGMPEANRNLLAMAAWTGFEQRSIHYEQLPRPYGTSKWTFRMKLKLVMDSFIEFSRAPLDWILPAAFSLVALGLVLLLAGLVLALIALGLAGAVAAICGTVAIVGGLNLAGVGLLGEYVWRAGDDARRRPTYVVKAVTSAASPPTSR
jgi:polyisoprenyl-phosphate glycosyltransferase